MADKREFFKNLILYGIFGAGGAVIDYGVFSLLVSVGIPILSKAEIATVISGICGFAFTFTTNTFLNFKKSDNLWRRFVSYGAICVLGMLLSAGALAVFEKYMNVYLLKAIVLVVVSAIQFVLNKLITYRK